MSEDSKPIRIAIVGCSHGELDIIYNTIRQQEDQHDIKIELLLCCGDFQAMRNDADLEHFHCPIKYRQLGDFHKYYSGEKEAPYLTVFIGGNHENSAFNMELPHGGWVAKNIYYMGFASVINFAGLRIGGWSGIFKPGDYPFTHHEAPPFDAGQQISAYHVRSIEKFRLSLLEDEKPNCLDIFMTHDWPVGITRFGNEEGLLRYKPYFKKDIEKGELGNPFSQKLLPELRPRHWFAAHLHCKFEATVPHKAKHDQPKATTEFLALHKCNRNKMNKNFFDIRVIKSDSKLSKELRYDPKWLAILKKTAQLEVATRARAKIPDTPEEFIPTDEDLKKIDEIFEDDYLIPQNFQMTAPPSSAFNYDPKVFFGAHNYRNPQTKQFCEKLVIPDLNEDLCKRNMDIVGDPYYLVGQDGDNVRDEGEIVLGEDLFEGDDEFFVDKVPSKAAPLDATDA